MRRPVLALDVDGALSPVRRPQGAVDRTWHDVARVDAPALLHLSRSLAGELAALDVERVWLTTWGELANEVVGRWLGWEPLPVLEDPPGRAQFGEVLSGSQVWKARALDAYVAEHRPPKVVWVDDQLGTAWSELRGVVDPWGEQGWPGVPLLLIGPHRHVGVSPADLDRIRGFLA